jgi:hypothetical protein
MMRLESLFLLLSFLLVGSSSFPSPVLLVPRQHLASSSVLAGSKWENDSSRPYTPDGLTAAQYNKILKKEKAVLAKKDFGAFGPRFLKAARPRGDWLLMKGLWTNGFQANSVAGGADGGGNGRPPKRAHVERLVRTYGPSFLLAYVFLDSSLRAVTMWRASQVTVRSATFMATRFLLFKQEQIQNSVLLVWQMQVLKLALAGALTFPMKRGVMERANRRWLWSPRRLLFAGTGAAISFLLLWGLLLVGVRGSAPIIL